MQLNLHATAPTLQYLLKEYDHTKVIHYLYRFHYQCKLC